MQQEEWKEVGDWAVSAGYAEQRDVWHARYFDDEADDWKIIICASEEEALYWVDEEEEEDEPSISCKKSIVLTEAGMAELERWHDPLDGLDGAVILYARDVLTRDMPDLVGIWWDEEYNPLSLSCPRGGIFPDRIADFDVTEDWDCDVTDLSLFSRIPQVTR